MAALNEEGATVGKQAPALRLRDHRGEWVDLASYRGRQSVIAYFYPKAGTAGCTAEACAFRDEYEEFKESGAEVIGVSSDSVEELRAFAAGNRLPFVLLSDEAGEARKAWGVPRDVFVLPGRVTYVVDREGIVRHAFRSAVRMKKHVEEAKRVLRELAR